MSALITWFLSNPAVLAVIAAVLGGLGWGVAQRRAGAKAERTKQLEERQKARDVADEVDNDIGATPPNKQREEMKTW